MTPRPSRLMERTVSSADERAHRPESARFLRRRARRWPTDSEFLVHEVDSYQACEANPPSTLAWDGLPLIVFLYKLAIL